MTQMAFQFSFQRQVGTKTSSLIVHLVQREKLIKRNRYVFASGLFVDQQSEYDDAVQGIFALDELSHQARILYLISVIHVIYSK